jgi:hypothetical protein
VLGSFRSDLELRAVIPLKRGPEVLLCATRNGAVGRVQAGCSQAQLLMTVRLASSTAAVAAISVTVTDRVDMYAGERAVGDGGYGAGADAPTLPAWRKLCFPHDSSPRLRDTPSICAGGRGWIARLGARELPSSISFRIGDIMFRTDINTCSGAPGGLQPERP